MLEAAINGKIINKAAIIELAKSTQFVRFNKVKAELYYYKSGRTIEEKCKIFANYLHDIEAITLNGLNQIHFSFSIIKKCESSFSDQTQMFNYLQKELLPVCGRPRSYKFEFYIEYNKVEPSGTNTIAQILQMHPIDRCSNIELILYGIRATMQWPIEAISDWLHQKSDGIAEKSQKRFLKIYSDGWKNQNERELQLCDHLRKVKTLNNFLKLQFL